MIEADRWLAMLAYVGGSVLAGILAAGIAIKIATILGF